jgi:phage terminase large subunit-like protein
VAVPVVILMVVLVNQEVLAEVDRVGEQMQAVLAQQGKDMQVEPVRAVLPVLHRVAEVVLAQ